jgi:lysophospholipase L1-like esterase
VQPGRLQRGHRRLRAPARQRCTTGELCSAGACGGGSATDCSAFDDQCTLGACNEVTDACEPQPTNEGLGCDDGLFCTTAEICTVGVCGGGSATDCSAFDDQCNQGVCNEGTDACEAQPTNEGLSCDDDLFCTTAELCTAGVCGGGSATDCSAFDDQCNLGVCNEATDACEAQPANEGLGCDDGLFCTTAELCTAGACGGGTATDCSAFDDQCTVGVCNEGTDACEPQPANEGLACDDGLFCTTSEVCIVGACDGGSATDCSSFDDQCNQGVCNEGTDACEAQPTNEGLACDDGLFCTTAEACSAGVCGGGSAIDCSAFDDQCNLGVCNEGTDACEAQFASQGSVCDDADPSTTDDVCMDGVCLGAWTVIVDNTDPPFTVVGSWSVSSGLQGFYGTDWRQTFPGSNGARTATWSFDIDSAGDYAISAQWVEGRTTAADDAPFTIYNDGLVVASDRRDQAVAGGRFNLLAVLPLSSGPLDVVLTSDASDWVVADAVKVSERGFAISSPRYNALSSSTDVIISMETLGFPSSWGVEFVVDANDPGAIQNYSPPYTQLITGLALGEHTVEAFLIDPNGNRVSPYSTDLSLGVGDYHVAFGDSLTSGTGDDISADEVSADLRNRGTGFPPILNDLLTGARGYSQTVENEGKSGRKSSNGAAVIADVLAAHPDSQTFLILFGTNDAFNEIPSGMGLSSGDPNYPGSYKDNMTQIISAVIAAGKEPALAKVPLCLGDFSGTPFPDPATAPLNLRIQEYNVVIDEMVSQFSIAIPPPDFYAHFEANPGEFADDCHMNGVGYQSMANLWLIALSP